MIDAKGVEIGTKPDSPKTIDSRCGVHVPMRWSTLCAIYKYERGVHMPRVAGEKSFTAPMIAQGTERWYFHGLNGIEEIDDGTLVTGEPGYNFGCSHSPISPGGGIIIALRPGALDEDERSLFARGTLRAPKLRNFGHASRSTIWTNSILSCSSCSTTCRPPPCGIRVLHGAVICGSSVLNALSNCTPLNLFHSRTWHHVWDFHRLRS